MGWIDNSTPAFPGENSSGASPGMSLRDWFAGLAMQAAVTAEPHYSSDSPEDADIARDAYDIADAMLEARKK